MFLWLKAPPPAGAGLSCLAAWASTSKTGYVLTDIVGEMVWQERILPEPLNIAQNFLQVQLFSAVLPAACHGACRIPSPAGCNRCPYHSKPLHTGDVFKYMPALKIPCTHRPQTTGCTRQPVDSRFSPVRNMASVPCGHGTPPEANR